MKKYSTIIFAYLLCIMFLIALAVRVNEIDKRSVSNTSVAINVSEYN